MRNLSGVLAYVLVPLALVALLAVVDNDIVLADHAAILNVMRQRRPDVQIHEVRVALYGLGVLRRSIPIRAVHLRSYGYGYRWGLVLGESAYQIAELESDPFAAIFICEGLRCEAIHRISVPAKCPFCCQAKRRRTCREYLPSSVCAGGGFHSALAFLAMMVGCLHSGNPEVMAMALCCE